MRRIIEYWQKTAEHDYRTMEILFENRRYSDSLFFSHIVKSIKGLEILKKDLIFFRKINTFNIRARYPDFKLNLYKVATKEFSELYLNRVKLLYRELCQKLKS